MAAGCCTIDVQVAMLRLLFFGRLVRWGTAPLFAVLQAGDGHVSSWTTAVRRDLAWLRKPEVSAYSVQEVSTVCEVEDWCFNHRGTPTT